LRFRAMIWALIVKTRIISASTNGLSLS
jgi:hypothetical protein